MRTTRHAATLLVLTALGCTEAVPVAAPSPAAPALTPQFEHRDFESGWWYSGNTHAHTTNSDGDAPPSNVVEWYRSHGYNFLVISDHDKLTDPATLQSLTNESFILVPGEEVTATYGGPYGDPTFTPVHVTAVGLPRVVQPLRDTTVLATLQTNIDAVHAAGAVPIVNHPNFFWALNADILRRATSYSLLEVYNAHPRVNTLGDATHPSVEAMWDEVLSAGKRVYGVASDDAHAYWEFSPVRENPGRAGVWVRSPRLTPEDIVRNLADGRFYASTGVRLADILVEPTTFTIQIQAEPQVTYVTHFIGTNGRRLASTTANPAVYELKDQTGYVRARVEDSNGKVAWVQPVFIEMRPVSPQGRPGSH